MGNCNFHEATATLETEHLTGTVFPSLTLNRNYTAAGLQGKFPVPLRDRQGRFWEGVESGKEKGQVVVCHEGNVEGTCTH